MIRGAAATSVRRQRGSALILFLGVAAALSVLSLAVVVLVTNTQANTARERSRTKAFNVAEAALDVAMLELTRNWPTVTSPTPFDYTGFESNFPAEEFSRPTIPGASFVSVDYVDDLTSGSDRDFPSNGILYVDAQAVIGTRAARVRAKVQAVYYDLNLLHGIAVWTGGQLLSTGGGGNPDIVVEVFPPGSTTVSVASVGGVAEDDVRALFMPLLEGEDAPTREEVLSTATIEGLVELAKESGRYFGTDNGYATAEAAWAAADPRKDGSGYEGLVVIDAPVADATKALQLGPRSAQQSYNTEARPGILMIMDRPILDNPSPHPAGLQFNGSPDYYGVIYCQGPVSTGNGTPIIHGMLITESDFNLIGTADIRYNDRCMSQLSNQWLTNTRLVPNGWRELQPVVTRER
jgi:type II secretory pathway pseudopilin PulG